MGDSLAAAAGSPRTASLGSAESATARASLRLDDEDLALRGALDVARDVLPEQAREEPVMVVADDDERRTAGARDLEDLVRRLAHGPDEVGTCSGALDLAARSVEQ